MHAGEGAAVNEQERLTLHYDNGRRQGRADERARLLSPEAVERAYQAMAEWFAVNGEDEAVTLEVVEAALRAALEVPSA